MQKTFGMIPKRFGKVRKIAMSPKDFMGLSIQDRLQVKSSRIIPPKIGSGSLGLIEVEFK